MTYQQINAFASAAMVRLNPSVCATCGRGGPIEDNKFNYALQRVFKRAKLILDAYNEQVEDFSIEHAATTKEGIVERETSGIHGYKYTKSELQARNKQIRALFYSEIAITPHFATDAPIDLTVAEREAFEGFVLQLPKDALDTAEKVERQVEEAPEVASKPRRVRA